MRRIELKTTDEFLSHFGDKLIFEALGENQIPAMYGSYKQWKKRLQELNKRGYNIYFTVNEMKPGTKRTKDKFKKARAVWIDDDKSGKIQTFPIDPSITVESSPGKYQYYWLTEQVDINEWQSIMNGLTEEYNGDPKAKLVTQILRVPGYVNNKYPDKPLSKVINGCNLDYTWDTISSKFPAKEIIVEENHDRDNDTPFDVNQFTQNIVSGEDIHNSRIRLAFHFVNNGMPRETIFNILKGLVETGVSLGNIDRARADERISNMYACIDDAIKQVEGEKIKYEIDEEDSSGRYTDLPYPSGFLGEIAKDIEKYMYYPSKEMAIATAMHCVSVFGGGTFRIMNKTVTRKRTLLAPTARGKSAIENYFNELIRELSMPNDKGSPRIQNTWDFSGSEVYTPLNIHNDLVHHRVRSYIITEAGQAGKSKAGDTFNKRKYILDLVSRNYKDVQKSPQLSIATAANREVNDTLKPLHGAVAVFMSESVPDIYTEVLHSEDAFRSGDVGREEIIFVDPHMGKKNRNAQDEINPDVVDAMCTLANRLRKSKSEVGTDPVNFKSFTPIDTSLIDDELDKLEDRIMEQRNKAVSDNNYIQYALLSRLFERILVTVLIQVIADYANCLGIKATMPQLKYAIKYQEEVNRAVLAQSKQGSLASNIDICITRLQSRLVEFGSRSDDKKYAKSKDFITPQWFSRVFDVSNNKQVQTLAERHGSAKKARQLILEEAEDRGLITNIRPNKVWRSNI